MPERKKNMQNLFINHDSIIILNTIRFKKFLSELVNKLFLDHRVLNFVSVEILPEICFLKKS